MADELETKSKAIADLEVIAKHRGEKLAEAQRAQVELLRKSRELEEEKQALEPTATA